MSENSTEETTVEPVALPAKVANVVIGKVTLEGFASDVHKTDVARMHYSVKAAALKLRTVATVDEMSEASGLSRAMVGRLVNVGHLLITLNVQSDEDGVKVQYVYTHNTFQSIKRLDAFVGYSAKSDPEGYLAVLLEAFEALKAAAAEGRTLSREARPDDGGREDTAPVKVTSANVQQRAEAALNTLRGLNLFARETGVDDTPELVALATALVDEAITFGKFVAAIRADVDAEDLAETA